MCVICDHGAYRRVSRTVEYTSAFNSLAGPRFVVVIGAACPEPDELTVCVFVLCPTAPFLRQKALKLFAPVSPPPLIPRQNSRPRKVPPRKPWSVGSLGSTVRKKDWAEVCLWRDSKRCEVSRRIEWTARDLCLRTCNRVIINKPHTYYIHVVPSL